MSTDVELVVQPKALEKRYRMTPMRRSTAAVFWVLLAMFAALAMPFVSAAMAWAGIVGLLALVVGMFARMLRVIRLSRRWGDEYSDADAHLRSNELDDAERILEPLCAATGPQPAMHALTVMARATIERRRGNLDQAVAMVDGVVGSGWLRRRGGLHSQLPLALAESAVLHALLGRPDAARERLDSARKETSDVRRAVLALAEAIVAARGGDHAEVLAVVARYGRRVEGLLSPPNLRALAVIEAYALEHRGEAGYREEADARVVGEALAGAHPFEAGEYDYLGVRWPAMQEFLEAHGLASPVAA